MNDPKVGNVCKSVTFGQEEYTKLEQDAVLAGAGEEVNFIKCFDDVTGKELLAQGVKEAREQELKYLREHGVYEKVVERATVEKHQVTPVDTKWVDANPFTTCCGSRPNLYAGTLPPEALKAIKSIAVSHSLEFSLVHVDVSRAYFHAKVQRLVLVKLPA